LIVTYKHRKIPLCTNVNRQILGIYNRIPSSIETELNIKGG